MALAICAISRASFAQSASGPIEEPRVEFWGAVTPGQMGPSGSVVSSYSPPLLLDGSDYTSHASQTVTFDGQAHVGFEAGSNLFFARHAGLQLIFDRQSPDLEGTNGPYDVTLNYISRPPPDNQAIPVTVHKSTPWPDTTGSITQSTFSLNGVVRAGTASRIDVTFSGGLSIQRLSGTVQPVGFTQYNLGGHSVLFENEYHLAMSLGPTSAVGFNLGGDLNVHVARQVALLFGYRYFGGPSVDMPVHVASVLNPEEHHVRSDDRRHRAVAGPGACARTDRRLARSRGGEGEALTPRASEAAPITHGAAIPSTEDDRATWWTASPAPYSGAAAPARLAKSTRSMS